MNLNFLDGGGNGISTIVSYLMPNPLYTYILNLYMICKPILQIAFLNEPELFFVHSFKCVLSVQYVNKLFSFIPKTKSYRN